MMPANCPFFGDDPKIEKEINSRPMKCLGWRTPSEALLKESHRLIV